MHPNLSAAWYWFKQISPWLIVSFIPSIINGLMPYRQASGVVKALHVLLDFLSVLARSDSPSTFKPPLTPSQPPPLMMPAGALVGGLIMPPGSHAIDDTRVTSGAIAGTMPATPTLPTKPAGGLFDDPDATKPVKRPPPLPGEGSSK